MKPNKGFSLLELLISLSLGGLVILSILGVFDQFQTGLQNATSVMDRDQTLQLAIPLLFKWVLPAGSNRWGKDWSGIQFETRGSLSIQADISGPKGIPDGALDSSFEDITIRQSRSNLQLRSRSGRFQPFLGSVQDFEILSDQPELPLLRLRIIASTRRLLRLNRVVQSGREIHFSLPNFLPTLFPPI